jgi:hypothetical protein
VPDDQASSYVSDHFKGLKDLEERAQAAKLDQARAEAEAAAAKARQPSLELPSLDTELAQDTATVGEKSGLAGPLVQLSSGRLADDIADLALDATRGPTDTAPAKYTMRVVSTLGFLGEIDAHRILRARLHNLRTRLDPFMPPPDGGPPPEPGAEPAADEEAAAALALAPAAALAGAGVQGLGLLSKLLAGNYHVAGEDVTVSDLGFDLLVAHRLQAKKQEGEDVAVEVDRLLPTRDSSIAADLWKLALDADEHLVPATAAGAATLAQARGTLSTAEDGIAAIDEQVLELTKNLKKDDKDVVVPERDKLAAKRDELSGGLAALRRAVAEAREPSEQKAELLKAIADLVTFAITPAVAGGAAPLTQAARAEGLLSGGSDGRPTLVLYCKLLVGGMNTTVENRVIRSDRWIGLAGSTAEFALLKADGTVLESGVRTAFEETSGKLGDGNSFKRTPVLYVPLERRQR